MFELIVGPSFLRELHLSATCYVHALWLVQKLANLQKLPLRNTAHARRSPCDGDLYLSVLAQKTTSRQTQPQNVSARDKGNNK